ncbi:MAG: hypothetical protein BroJett033_4520 [Chloroflexota bacterium]|nr:MAG: hypothetical protein BroJett033_4520 [Chloroflexota bacterium]
MHYPEQRQMLAWTTVRRERLLPEGAVGLVEARRGQVVNLLDVVARGSLPARYIYVEAAAALGLRHENDLIDRMLVELGETVEAAQPLAGQPGGRGRRVLAPADGVVAYIGRGRVIIQTTPKTVELQSGLVGTVTGVIPNRGVTIEAFGALFQGVWGNGRRAIGTLRMEPEGGLEATSEDSIQREYRRAVVVTRRALTAAALDVAEAQQVGGVIAPAMDSALLPRALAATTAVMLTEGFGDLRLGPQGISLLEGFAGRAAMLDAHQPGRWDTVRVPEVFINLPPKSDGRPPMPDIHRALSVGMTVRLTREPHAGWIGQITELPRAPQPLASGLRVPCARVALTSGEMAVVPLANLEFLGR